MRIPENIEKIMEKLNIQELIYPLLVDGKRRAEQAKLGTYNERLDEAEKKAMEKLSQQFNRPEAFKKAADNVQEYVSIVEDVYMEIGMVYGVVLVLTEFVNMGRGLEDEQ